jgi:hypothetical protein
MMAKMRRLPANGVPPMAVGAANFAPLDLRSEILECVFIERERYDTFASFGPYVVELEDHHIGFPAADTRGVAKMIQQVAEVAPLERSVGRDALLEIQAPRSSGAQGGASTMTTRADDLAERHLSLDPPESISLMYQHGDIGRLVSNVIELQDERVGQPAVRASRRCKKAEHVAPGLPSSAFAGCTSLPAMQLSTVAHVFGSALLAPIAARVEIRQGQPFLASSTAPLLDRLRGWWKWSRGRRLRQVDSPRPDAHRAEGDSEFPRDGAQGLALRAKASGFLLLPVLSGRHTNICSPTVRT